MRKWSLVQTGWTSGREQPMQFFFPPEDVIVEPPKSELCDPNLDSEWINDWCSAALRTTAPNLPVYSSRNNQLTQDQRATCGRAGGVAKPIVNWKMCNRLAWNTNGMPVPGDWAEQRNGGFAVMPAFSIFSRTWAWMGVWRMHSKARKMSKENWEHGDCIYRQQEQTAYCKHWVSTSREELLAGGGLCAC